MQPFLNSHFAAALLFLSSSLSSKQLSISTLGTFGMPAMCIDGPAEPLSRIAERIGYAELRRSNTRGAETSNDNKGADLLIRTRDV